MEVSYSFQGTGSGFVSLSDQTEMQARLESVSQTKCRMQSALKRLQTEGASAMPVLCREWNIQEPCQTVDMLMQIMKRQFQDLCCEEKTLEEQYSQLIQSSPNREKRAPASSEGQERKRKVEEESQRDVQISDAIDIQELEARLAWAKKELEARLAWAKKEHERFDSYQEALGMTNISSEMMDEITVSTDFLRKETMSLPQLRQNVSLKMKRLADQIQSIQNRLFCLQKDMVDGEVRGAIDTEDLDLLLRLHADGQLNCDAPFLAKHGGMTPLTYAISHGKLETATLLLTRLQADPNCKDATKQPNVCGMSPLLTAIMHGDIRFVALLLRHGAFADLPCGGILPLSYAVWLKEYDCVECLLRSLGRNVNRRALGGIGPLQMAILAGDRRSIQLLVRAGVDVNGIDGQGASPLTFAYIYHKKEEAKELIDLGADIKKADGLGRVPDSLFKTTRDNGFDDEELQEGR